MPLASNIKFHDSQFYWQVPQGTWRWTTRLNMSGSAPSFQIIDIISPFGLLRDSIPLPGEVVTKMAESIVELMQAYAPRILLSASSLTITLDEGRGFGTPQSITLTNNGAYGSLLGASVTSSAAYVTATPANLSLGSGASGAFQVNADSTSLLASGSPYAVTLTVQDPSATNSPQTINVTVVVRPKATILLTPDDLAFNASGPIGGPWPPVPAQTFQVLNNGSGASVLDFQIQKLQGNSPWLTSFSPTSGVLAGAAALNVTVNVAPQANMMPGVYTEYLRVSGYSSNTYQDVLVTLTIL